MLDPYFELHNGLAGLLSHPAKLPSNAHYIGTLSRFSDPRQRFVPQPMSDYDIFVAISGLSLSGQSLRRKFRNS